MSLTPAAERWSALCDEHEASGLTVKDFAAQRGVNPSTLSWWRSRLGRAARTVKVSPFVTLDVTPVAQPEREDEDDATVVLALVHLAAHVVVDRDTDLRLLRDLLDALC